MSPEQTVSLGTGIDLCYQRYGAPSDPPLLLVAGLGAQLSSWHPDLLQELAGQRLQLIVFDNRDIGRSTHLDAAGPVDAVALMAGRLHTAPYLLADMADDAVGLLDALGIESAHMLGVSMGGMIAQSIAIEHPERVRSLISMLSTPAAGVGAATAEAGQALLAPAARTREEAIERSLQGAVIIGSPGYERDEGWIRDSAGRAWDRDSDRVGVSRQLAAIRLSPDRRPALAQVRVPVLVIHGDADPLVQVDGGRQTAAAVPDAQLLLIPGMGHDLPRAVWPQVVAAVTDLIRQAEGARA